MLKGLALALALSGLVATFSGAVAAEGAAADAAAEAPIVLRAAHLFDGTSDRLVSPGVVVSPAQESRGRRDDAVTPARG